MNTTTKTHKERMIEHHRNRWLQLYPACKFKGIAHWSLRLNELKEGIGRENQEERQGKIEALEILILQERIKIERTKANRKGGPK